MRELLIDADIFLYKATRLSEREINWGGDSWTLHCDLAEVKTIIDDQIWKVQEGSQADKVLLCFSDKRKPSFILSTLLSTKSILKLF